MGRLAQRKLPGVLLAFLAVACAHGPTPRRPLLAVSWPGPPLAPRVRLAALLPDPDAPAPRRSLWRAALDLVAGTDPDDRPDAWLVRPFGIAAAPGGAAFVADPDAAAVLRLDPTGAISRLTCPSRKWGAPMAVALGEAGALLVADAGTAEIVIVAPDRTCRAIGAGALERPTGVAAGAGRVLAVDPPRHQVVVFSPAGEVVARWGARGAGDGQLNFPTAIARAPDGAGFLVVDALNFRIARFSADGAWLGSFGAPGEEGAGFARPKSVAVDETGRIYVSDAQRDLVLVFAADGAFEYALGERGSEPGAFSHPAGVAVAAGRLYVADSHNRRIQVFEILGASS